MKSVRRRVTRTLPRRNEREPVQLEFEFPDFASLHRPGDGPDIPRPDPNPNPEPE